jgi:hypothetical protein
MSRHWLPSALIGVGLGLGACARVAAADGLGFGFDDVRLTITRLPTSEPVHVDYADPSTNLSEDIAGLHPGVRVDLGATLKLARLARSTSLVMAIAVFDGQQESAVDPNRAFFGAVVGPIKVGTQGLDVGLGLATRVGGGFHIELVPFAGVGFAKVSDRAILGGSNPPTTFVESGGGTYSEYGIRTGIYYTGLRNHLQVGLGVGYMDGRMDGKLQFNENNFTQVMVEKVIVETKGLAPFLSLGYRF